MPQLNPVLRVLATVGFILAIFGVPWSTPVMIAGSLALWCGSTLA